MVVAYYKDAITAIKKVRKKLINESAAKPVKN